MPPWSKKTLTSASNLVGRTPFDDSSVPSEGVAALQPSSSASREHQPIAKNDAKEVLLKKTGGYLPANVVDDELIIEMTPHRMQHPCLHFSILQSARREAVLLLTLASMDDQKKNQSFCLNPEISPHQQLDAELDAAACLSPWTEHPARGCP
jgi:hypothetical protein